MKDYNKSDYALNKDSEHIVYRFVTGTVRITLKDFLAENPDMTEADFTFWKAYSDNDYLIQDRSEYRQTWKNMSFDIIPETVASTEPTPEEMFVDAPEEIRRKARLSALGARAWHRLTKNQQRRFRQYHVQRMTEEQIAAAEGVTHQAVSKNLLSSERKIRKFLKTFEKQVAETASFSRIMRG